jgi:hypothetical protein
MARGRKTGGRQKGSRNRGARAAARATGVLPLDYMLSVMRDPDADQKRREAMAMAAASYLHSKLSAIEAKLSPAVAEPSPEKRGGRAIAQGIGVLAALAPVYDWFTEGFDTRDLKEAKALLDELQT